MTLMEKKAGRFRVVADFFDEMAKMARDVLKPSNQGGLGARTGSISYVRYVAGPPPANSWEPPTPPVKTTLPVRAHSFGISKQLVGTQIDNTTLIATDLYVICERIPDGYQPTDVIEIDGKTVTTLSVTRIPAAGIASAVKFIVRK